MNDDIYGKLNITGDTMASTISKGPTMSPHQQHASGAIITQSHIDDCNVTNPDVTGGNFTYPNLNRATLIDSKLTNAHLNVPILDGPVLNDTSSFNTVFSGNIQFLPGSLIEIGGDFYSVEELKMLLSFVKELHKDLKPEHYKEKELKRKNVKKTNQKEKPLMK